MIIHDTYPNVVIDLKGSPLGYQMEFSLGLFHIQLNNKLLCMSILPGSLVHISFQYRYMVRS